MARPKILLPPTCDDVENLLSQMAIEYGLTKSEIEVIVNTQFRFVNNRIENLDTHGILLHNLGSFNMQKATKKELLTFIQP